MTNILNLQPSFIIVCSHLLMTTYDDGNVTARRRVCSSAANSSPQLRASARISEISNEYNSIQLQRERRCIKISVFRGRAREHIYI